MNRPGVDLAVTAVRSVIAAELGLADEVAAVTTTQESGRFGRELLAAVAHHRVVPLLAPAGEPLGLAPDVVASLQRAQGAQTLSAMATLARTVQVSSALNSGGVPHLMLKGVALAQQTTGTPTSRGAGDVDFLVPPGCIRQAVEALAYSGLQVHAVGSPAPGMPTFPAIMRSQKELTLLCEDVEIDVHWRLDDTRQCLAWQFDELASAAEYVVLGGVRVPTLGRAHSTIYNASHAGSDSWSHLRALVDQLRLQRGQDLAGLRAEARRVGAVRRWDLAQAMAAKLVGEPAPVLPRGITATANAMWRWLLAGQGPRERRNALASARGLGTNLWTLDSPRAVLQRAEVIVWPVGAMADRALGEVGDEYPWLYTLATPYFLPKRLLERWGLVAGIGDSE